MQTIDNDLLTTITGGRARATTDKLDTKTELALTSLTSNIKELAKPQQNNQLTQLMTFAMMSRLANR